LSCHLFFFFFCADEIDRGRQYREAGRLSEGGVWWGEKNKVDREERTLMMSIKMKNEMK